MNHGFVDKSIRYKGSSMVNRLIGYLGHPPFVIHRLDMDTSGVLLCAKSKHVVEPIANMFRWTITGPSTRRQEECITAALEWKSRDNLFAALSSVNMAWKRIHRYILSICRQCSNILITILLITADFPGTG